MDQDRLVNLLGQVALGTTDAVDAALVAASGLTAGDATALIALDGFAGGRQPEVLRDALALSQPGVAHVVRRLADRGLVLRAADPDDGRAIRVELTPAGRRRARELAAVRRAVLTERLAALEEEEVAVLGALLAKLATVGVASRAAARHVCRRCDVPACGHPAGCPVTARVDELIGR